MDELAARYRGLLEPEGSGRDAAYAREAHTARYADDAHAFLPGTWFMAGHHRGRAEIDALWEAVRLVWPAGTRLFRTHVFVGEDTLGIEWWSRNEVWNGVEARNSGVGRLRFRDGLVVDHHEITDSEYFEEIHGNWRPFLGPELGRKLPRWERSAPPFYPDPALNEWALDDSHTDGVQRAPPSMRGPLEAVRAWWEDPDAAGDALFADDVHLFFQGRLWPLGGHHRGRTGLERVREVCRRLWRRSRRVRTNLWAEESRVLVEWFSEKVRWDGQPCRDAGFSVWDFREGRVAAIRTYVDTSFYAEVLAGWRQVVGEELGALLPNWRPPGSPRYPDPGDHV